MQLTDEAEVVAGHDIWDSNLNAALADVERRARRREVLVVGRQRGHRRRRRRKYRGLDGSGYGYPPSRYYWR